MYFFVLLEHRRDGNWELGKVLYGPYESLQEIEEAMSEEFPDRKGRAILLEGMFVGGC